jgi:hypothetical protein
MKNILKIMLLSLTLPVLLLAQQKDREDFGPDFWKPLGIEDRAGGTHNASNIGLFFENRGKLYPRRLSQGPCGEFPINSGKHYIYRINPFVAFPGNVIQGRYTSNEEWEAVGGYHNPAFTKIAFSDNPKTWPETGWPVKDNNGKPIIKSDQDSYCVYSDENNGVKRLGVYVAQTGYTYGVKFAQNIIFYKFEISNQGPEDLQDMYFNIYFDCDVGNVSGGDPEYGDDLVEFDRDRNLVIALDDGFSSEWPGGKTGQFGYTFLSTPSVNGVEKGITDFHYNLYDYDVDIDSVQYAIASSDTSFLIVPGQFHNYFHPGPDNNLHFDDPANIPAAGFDILSNLSSGPYALNRGDTLTFYTAIIAGNNREELLESWETAQNIFQLDFEASKPPQTPTLSAVAGDERVTLFWNDVAEQSIDNFSGQYDFAGYRLYKSVDYGIHWDQNDRNVDPGVGIDPVPLAEFFLGDNVGANGGIQHSYVDTDVNNGFEYWYSLTAFDRGDSTLESLEGARGSILDAINLVAVIPSSAAIDRHPVNGGNVTHFGKGQANYNLEILPADIDSLAGNTYIIGFTYSARKKRAISNTQIDFIITDSLKTLQESYLFEFLSSQSMNVLNLTQDIEIGNLPARYRSGAQYTLNPGLMVKFTDPDPLADPELLPMAGDFIYVDFSVYVIRNGTDTVITPRAYAIANPQATTDGVIFQMSPPEMIQNVLRQSGSDDFAIEFLVADESLLQNNNYLVSVENSGFNSTINEAFATIMVRDSSQSAILTVDSLYNNSSFEFHGIEASVSFPEQTSPATNNVYSFTSVVPAMPTLADQYQFQIEGSSLNRSEMKTSIKNIKVVPNPYIVGSKYEREYGELRREPIRKIKFINLPSQCTIHIFSVAGDRVKIIEHNSDNGSATWDLRASGGREVATGVYIYVVKADDVEYINRFAVIK